MDLAADDHVRGEGPLQLLMYGDFECPYCVAAQRIVPRVRARLGDDLTFVFRHFPLPEVHPHAQAAAEASEAAGDRFWAMHDELYRAGGRLQETDLLRFARAAGVDPGAVAAALRGGTYRDRVARDLASGRAAGVDGTPAFFANGRRVEGAFDAGSLIDALRS